MRVPAVCAHPKELDMVAATASPPCPPGHWTHESHRKLVRIVPPVPGLFRCFTHDNCVCNELVSATNRVVGQVPLPTPDGLIALRKEAFWLKRRLGHVDPISVEEFLQHYSGPKRTRYELAWESLKHEPLTRADARVSAFIKAEKIDPDAKVNPDPRMIQSRRPRYNIMVGRYLKAIERRVYALKHPRSKLPMVAKCLNSEQRADLLGMKLERFDDPVVAPIDCKRWDKHVAEMVLEIEHMVYNYCAGDPELARILSWQLINIVKTKNGVKWRLRGGRMSGDFNTALGNVLLMLLMVFAAMRAIGIRKWDCLDDGDDCLVIVERRDLERLVDGLPKQFLRFGQEVTMFNIASEVNDVEFCRCRPVEIRGKYKFVRDWRRVLSCDTSGIKHWGDPNLVKPMLRTIGVCNLAMYSGVPILQEHALACMRLGGGAAVRMDLLAQDDMWYRYSRELGDLTAVCAKSSLITAATRLSFERTWGVSIEEQLDIESRLALWTLDCYEPADYPREIGKGWCDIHHRDLWLPQI